MFFENYPTTNHVEAKVRKFCETYKIDSYRCAAELFSFAKAFESFNFDLIESKADASENSEEDTNADCESDSDVEVSFNGYTFIDCLSILTDSNYKLIDAQCSKKDWKD